METVYGGQAFCTEVFLGGVWGGILIGLWEHLTLPGWTQRQASRQGTFARRRVGRCQGPGVSLGLWELMGCFLGSNGPRHPPKGTAAVARDPSTSTSTSARGRAGGGGSLPAPPPPVPKLSRDCGRRRGQRQVRSCYSTPISTVFGVTDGRTINLRLSHTILRGYHGRVCHSAPLHLGRPTSLGKYQSAPNSLSGDRKELRLKPGFWGSGTRGLGSPDALSVPKAPARFVSCPSVF